MIEKRFRTINDSAATIGVSRSTIYKLLDDGELTSVKIGKTRRIPADSLTAYVDKLSWRAVNGKKSVCEKCGLVKPIESFKPCGDWIGTDEKGYHCTDAVCVDEAACEEALAMGQD
jgi:excisionase family DNA binding protein